MIWLVIQEKVEEAPLWHFKFCPYDSYLYGWDDDRQTRHSEEKKAKENKFEPESKEQNEGNTK